MNSFNPFLTRRDWLRGSVALGAAAFLTPGLFAEELARTPRLTEGPFYPDKLPLDTDNDLVIVSNSITPAVGEITHLTGRVLGVNGDPLRDLVVEIWQVDGRGVYLHSADSGRRQRDTNFQGFGRATTNARGEYRFRTVKPVPYPGRTPHIHFKIKRGDRELLTTQLFVNGHPQNRNDMVFSRAARPADPGTCSFSWISDQSASRGSASCRARNSISWSASRPRSRPEASARAGRARKPAKPPLRNRLRRLAMRHVPHLIMLTLCLAAPTVVGTAQEPKTRPGDSPKAPAKGEPANKAAVDAIVARLMAFDKNKDGKLTRDEITDARLLRRCSTAPTPTRMAWSRREELVALATQMVAEQGQDGGDKGGRAGGPGGFGPPGGRGPGGASGPPRPGQILPPFLQESLKLTDTQKKQLADLQSDVDTRLGKILTDDQKKQLKELRKRGPGGPGGQKPPPPPPPE